MANTRRTINPLEEAPEQKAQVTKPFMVSYMKSNLASEEDKEWFKEVVSNPENQKEYTNKLNGKKYTDIDIPKVRMIFCQRFYPNLLGKKKKNKTFIDTIMEL